MPFLSQLPTVTQFGNRKIKLLVTQHLLLDPVLRCHCSFTALLDAAIERNGNGGADAKVPGIVVLLASANWFW